MYYIIEQKTKALSNDRFLVQLTKLDQVPSTSPVSPDEIAKMWESVNK